VLISIFAYFISPDPSPYANRIILETGGRKPGSSQQFLRLKKENKIPPTGFLDQLMSGREDDYFYVPVMGYQIQGDSIIVQKFIDEGLTERQSWHLSKVATDPVVENKFLLGTDKYGRDILSRLLVGTRVSLSVGLITVFISVTLGILLDHWLVILAEERITL